MTEKLPADAIDQLQACEQLGISIRRLRAAVDAERVHEWVRDETNEHNRFRSKIIVYVSLSEVKAFFFPEQDKAS